MIRNYLTAIFFKALSSGLVVLGVLACPVVLQAQANWQPGYVIKDGKKTEGEIDDREWPYYIDEFKFRASSKDKTTVFTTLDDVGFEVDGRLYVSKEISYITNSRELDKISKDTLFQRATTKAFLRQYYDGALSLYQFVDRTEKRHFYLGKDDRPLEYLEYELRLRENLDRKVVRYLENYKYQLSKILDDCPQLAKQISKSSYRLNHLAKIVGKWYSCRSESPDYSLNISQGDFSIGALVGIVHTTAVPRSNERGEISNEADVGGMGGLAVRYVFPGARQKFAVKLETMYHAFTDVARIQSREGASSTTVIRRKFDAEAIQLHLLAEIKIVTGKFSVYAEGGAVGSFLLSSDQVQTQIAVASDGSETSFDQDLNTSTNTEHEFGGLLGVGVRQGGLQLSIRSSVVARFRGNSGIGFLRAGVLAGYWF